MCLYLMISLLIWRKLRYDLGGLGSCLVGWLAIWLVGWAGKCLIGDVYHSGLGLRDYSTLLRHMTAMAQL